MIIEHEIEELKRAAIALRKIANRSYEVLDPYIAEQDVHDFTVLINSTSDQIVTMIQLLQLSLKRKRSS